jgi:uncharacterized protein
MRRVLRILVLLALIWGVIVGALYAAQRRLVFPANATRVDLVAAGLPDTREIILRAADGVELIAWTAAPKAGEPVVLYLHGNGGNLNSRGRVGRVRTLIAAGFGVIMVSWRGYGGSGGSPSEPGLHLDAAAAYLEARRLYPQAPVVAYGESLGTGPAVQLAARETLAALVLEAPFLSVLAVAQGQYPFVPVAQLLKDPFRSDLAMAQVDEPLLVLHGRQDRVVPFAQGRALYDAARGPRRFFEVAAAGHENLPAFGSLDVVIRFVRSALAGEIAGAAIETVN